MAAQAVPLHREAWDDFQLSPLPVPLPDTSLSSVVDTLVRDKFG